jgi:hypothetical protein
MVQLEIIPRIIPVLVLNIQKNLRLATSIAAHDARSGRLLGLDEPLSAEAYDIEILGKKLFVRRSTQSFDIEKPIDLLRGEPAHDVDIESLAIAWQKIGFSFIVSMLNKDDQYSEILTDLACAIAKSCDGSIAFFSPFFGEECPPGIYSEKAFFASRESKN